MIIKFFNKLRNSAAPAKVTVNRHTETRTVPKYWTEKLLSNTNDLLALLTHCQKANHPNVHRPLAWSPSESGRELSTLWKKVPALYSAPHAELSTRFKWARQLTDAFKAVGTQFPMEVPHFEVVVDKNDNCLISLDRKKFEFNPNHCVIFQGPQVFWMLSLSVREDIRENFILQHWLGSQVYDLLTNGAKAHTGLGWLVTWSRYLQGTGSAEDIIPQQYQQAEELSPQLNEVLRRMTSTDERYETIDEALEELSQAMAFDADLSVHESELAELALPVA